MRFIHASDLHIDSPLRGLDRYDGAPVERLRSATRSALERLVDRALAERVDFLLLAGDIYDRDWQDFHTGLFFRGRWCDWSAPASAASSCREITMRRE